jgi:hypothetical protein
MAKEFIVSVSCVNAFGFSSQGLLAHGVRRLYRTEASQKGTNVHFVHFVVAN